MEVKVHNNTITIKGNITTIADAEQIINILHSINDKDIIIIKILESFALPSSIIGELLKLHDMGKKIVLEVRDPVLYELIDDLNLTKTFSVKRI
ncbi:conserved hypothetical protein [Lebetimonas natsushimae]|uniref:STAS domain-containing protein n=1 Tax=Lebetimonas natsushimae TaxID=1936991 RepID=A0A292YCI6_9BACT|nr:hypothetical protein [Lebetimonas natsushimae]GAX87055.1 conserved hypothetical protein [Lebetimonas natsushimae]